jgi:hypothetical protein
VRQNLDLLWQDAAPPSNVQVRAFGTAYQISDADTGLITIGLERRLGLFLKSNRVVLRNDLRCRGLLINTASVWLTKQ